MTSNKVGQGGGKPNRIEWSHLGNGSAVHGDHNAFTRPCSAQYGGQLGAQIPHADVVHKGKSRDLEPIYVYTYVHILIGKWATLTDKMTT
jgi:hypothetical protein